MKQFISLLFLVLGISYSSFSQQNISYVFNNNGENLSSVDFNSEPYTSNLITGRELSKDNDYNEPSAWPDCFVPVNFRAIGYGATDNSIHVRWDDLTPSEDGVQYVIRYSNRSVMLRNWEEKVVRRKNYSILYGLVKNSEYSIQIKKVCDGLNTDDEISSDWVEINISLLNLREDYPPCEEDICDCWELLGEDATYEEIVNSDCFNDIKNDNCNILGSGLGDVVLNDNGTENDLTDDYLTFPLNPDGNSLEGGYNVILNGAIISPDHGNYGMNTDFFIETNGNEGWYTIKIESKENPNCSYDVAINHPGYDNGSNLCDI
jgi:hypothetical protein